MFGIGHQPVAQGPIHDFGCHHMIPRLQSQKHTRGRRHAGGKQQAGFRLFPHGNDGLGLAHGFIVGAAIDKARGIAIVGIADKGCRDMDGRHDAFGLGIYFAHGLRGQRAFAIAHLVLLLCHVFLTH